MSKINELRKKAAEAARKRDWSTSVKLYERVCDIDSNNPGFRNELGDVFLKMDDAEKALDAFERAAEAYRGVGLHNNAVAVYKKILRHDPHHVDALWGLGELKGQQGLDTDASSHYVDFLSHADKIPASQRQKFVNHCLLLVERYDDDLQMLSRIESIFESWKQGEDHARVLVQKARLAFNEGQKDLIDKYLARAREVYEDLELLEDYLQLAKDIGGELGESAARASAAIDLAATQPAEDLANDEGFLEIEDDQPAPVGAVDEQDFVPEHDPPVEMSRPVEPAGPISGPRQGAIDLGFDLEVPADGSRGVKPVEKRVQPGLVDLDDDAPAQANPSVGREAPGSVNLLDELLSDSSFDIDAAESGQVATIRADVGAQIAGNLADDDYAGQYEVGLVYLDMGLHENAAEAFALASRGKEQRLKALEMRGNALRQVGRNEDALVAYQEGLRTNGHSDRSYLGLHYEHAACLEQLGRYEEALQHFERAAAIDPDFLDVADRVRTLLASG